MRSALIGAACALFSFTCTQPTLAADFHPLASQDLTGGIYEFDDILIPEGVTLTLVGEPRQLTLRALGDLTLAGQLIGHGWAVMLDVGGTLHVTGSIDVGTGSPDVGSITLVSRVILIDVPRDRPRDASGDPSSLITSPGGNLSLGQPGGVTLAPAVPEPETWAMLLAGPGLVGLMARRRR